MSAPPPVIILDTNRFVSEFLKGTKGVVTEGNLREIVTQIVQLMLNEPLPYDDLFRTLPDFNRMTVIPSESIVVVKECTERLAQSIFVSLSSFKAFNNGTLDYFFDRFIGRDLVLHRLPH